MKPIEYLRKYNMKETDEFDHNAFVNDLAQDFISQIEFHQQINWSYRKFKNCVKEISQKYNSISNKVYGTGLPDKLWKYFYATIICKIRDEMFSEMMEKRRKEWEDQKRKEQEEKKREKKEQEDWDKKWEDYRQHRFGDFFLGFLKWSSGMGAPVTSFEVLGVDEDSSINDINHTYKSLVMKHHPDKGGNVEVFRKIIEAKNKCLAYINRKNKKDKSETIV